MPVFNQESANTSYVPGLKGTGTIPSIIPTGPYVYAKPNETTDQKDIFPNFFKNTTLPSITPAVSSYADAKRYTDQTLLFNPKRDNEDLYAKNQSFWNSVGNGLGRLVLTTGTKLGTGIGYLAGLAGVGNDAENHGGGVSGWITGAGDNALAQWFQGAEDTVKEDWLPIYKQTQDKDHGFFRRLGDLDFWTSDFVDGAAFMASAFVPGMAISKLGLGSKLVKGLAAYKGLIAADEAAALAAEGTSGISEAVNVAAKTVQPGANGLSELPKVLNWIDNAKLARNVNVGATTFVNTASEAMFEAKQTGDDIYNSLIGKRDPYTGKNIYTPDQAKQLSASAMRDTFLMNLGALSISNLWEANLMFKALPSKGTHLLGKVTTKGLLDDAELIKRSLATRVVSGLKPVGQGILAEGFWEENIQNAIQRLNTNSDNFDLNFTDKLKDLAGGYVAQTFNTLAGNDPENSVAIGLGGLMGAGFGAVLGEKAPNIKKGLAGLNTQVSAFKTLGNIYQLNDDGSIKFNSKNSPMVDEVKLKSYAASLNDVLNMHEVYRNLEKRGAGVLANVYKNELFARFAKAHFDAGLGDLLFQKLNDIKNIHKDDLISLGYDSSSGDVNAGVEELRKKATDLNELYDNIQQNYLPLSKDKGGKKFHAITDKMFYLSARNKSLSDELKNTELKYNNVKANVANYDQAFNSESDVVVEEYNKLFEDVEAAKRKKNIEDDYFSGLDLPSDYQTDNVTVVNGPSKLDQIKRRNKGVSVLLPGNNENADTIIKERQEKLDQYVKDNKEILGKMKSDSRGRYMYEVANKNLLPSAKEMSRLEVVLSELGLANNATLNVLSRLADLKYGEQYYDLLNAREIENADRELVGRTSDIISPTVPEVPKIAPVKIPPATEEELNDAYQEAVNDGKVTTNKDKVVDDLVNKIATGKTLTEEEQVIREAVKEDVEKGLLAKKEKASTSEIYEDIDELQQEREALINNSDRTVEEDARLTEIDDKLEELRDDVDEKFEESTNELIVGGSSNIKEEDKEKYKQILNQISRNKRRVVRTPKGYQIDGKDYRKVTDIIEDYIPDSRRAAISNAINAGYTVDDIVKAYFDNKITDTFRTNVSPRISPEAFDKLLVQLDKIKQQLQQKGIEIVGSNVNVWDAELGVAGEIDLLGVDKNGQFKIYEIEARKGKIWHKIFNQLGIGVSIRETTQKRLSAYRNLFANQFGVVPDDIALMFPFEVKYDEKNPSGFIEDVQLKKHLRFEPTANISVKRKVMEPVRRGSKFDHIDLLHIFADTFLTDDTSKAKMRFIMRNVSMDEFVKKIVLTVRKSGKEFQERFENQVKVLNGQETDYKITKYKDFENLYALVGNHELALSYDGTLVGYMSPAVTLAYKDAAGKFQVLDETTDPKVYAEVTGNSIETFGDFARIARAYKEAYSDVTGRLGDKESIQLDNDVLQTVFDVQLSYGEFDKVPQTETRPVIDDLIMRGVLVGKKQVITIAHVDAQDAVRVVMERGKKSTPVIKKLQEVDKWAANNVEALTKAMTNKDGHRVTEYVAIIELPNGEFRVIPLRKITGADVDMTDDFVTNLGGKFTSAVRKNVFKNENIMMVPKHNEEIVKFDLKDAEILGQIYKGEDIDSLEKMGLSSSDIDIKAHSETIATFVNGLTAQEKAKLNDLFGEDVINGILDEYQNGTWSSIEDFLENLKCDM